MSIHQDRLQALRLFREQSGKTTEQVLEAVQDVWGLDVFERAALEHDAALQERKADPSAARAATAAQQQAEHNARVADIGAHREFQRLMRENPFQAAAHWQRNAAAIERGRELDTPDSDPPPTAA